MLTNQRSKFSLVRDQVYLNCAYMAPLLKAVEREGIVGIQRKRNPAAVTTNDFFSDTEKVRKEFARLIQGDSERVVLVPSVSYGLANAAKNIQVTSAHSIVVAAEQFPSNFYPWQRLQKDTGVRIKAVAPPDSLTSRGRHWNERLLDAIDSSTKIVALGNVHWADGTVFDLKKIRTRTREVGAFLIIDGTQSVGALPFDVQQIQPDALVCAGYKWLMGPYSLGLAYYGLYFDSGTPIEENWINRLHSENFAGLVNYESEYQPGTLRYEVGEHSNFILVPMLLEALRQVNQWRPERIQTYCASITRKPIELLRAAGFWIEDEAFRGQHLFGIRLPAGTDMEAVKKQLQKHKISVSIRGNAIRVSPHVYNTETDMMLLTKALLKTKR